MLPKKRKSCPWEHGNDRLQDSESGVVLGNLYNKCRLLGKFATSLGREWTYCGEMNFLFFGLPRTVI
jgi:hypothetical protein